MSVTAEVAFWNYITLFVCLLVDLQTCSSYGGICKCYTLYLEILVVINSIIP